MRTGGVVLFGVGTCLALLVENEEALKRIERVERFESERRTEIMTGYDGHGHGHGHEHGHQPRCQRRPTAVFEKG